MNGTLHQKSVLCVGGRSSAVASYRDAVERAGGKFLHHDGGIVHNPHRLDANLAAADCVVCQTGNISHTAYWLVKNYCKLDAQAAIRQEDAKIVITTIVIANYSILTWKKCLNDPNPQA